MNLILQRVDDSDLIRRIDAANSSVALYAPGVSVAVAWALHRAAWRLGGAIKVVLDVSQKSVDMGYLEPAAVEIIWKLQRDLSAQIFFHLPGLRLGSLFVDEGRALVYAPVAKLMEDECYEQVTQCPSGLEVAEGKCAIDVRELALVIVDESMVARICDIKLKPAKSLSAIKAEYEQRIVESEKKVEEAEKRAKDAEKRAEEAEKKAVEDYKNRFKIRKVEFSVHSQPTAIGRKRATIPSMFLVGIGNEAEKKLIANYRLFPDEKEIAEYIKEKYPEEGIDKFAEMEKAIRDKYLLYVPHFGSYVRTCDMEAYEKEISDLEDLGKKVGGHIREALGKKIDAAIEGLYKVLEQQWKKSNDPWFEEYLRKHPQASRDRKEVFMAKMKFGVKGTNALVENFVPTIDRSSTPIDEALAENAEFIAALRKMLRNRNRIAGVEIIHIEDLITTTPKTKITARGPDPIGGVEMVE